MTWHIITVDPGVHKVGLAIGRQDAPNGNIEIVACETLDSHTKGPLVNERSRAVSGGYAESSITAQVVLSRVLESVYPGPDDKVLLVVERMQTDARTDGKVGDLLDVAATGGAIVNAICSEFFDASVLSPTPMAWKKNMPKTVCHNRVRARWPDLPKRLGHDALDAAGILKWVESDVLGAGYANRAVVAYGR